MEGLTERQQECVNAYRDCGESEMQTAKLLGIDVKALRNNLWLAHKKGEYFGPDKYCEHAPTGFSLDKSTIQVNGDGEIVQRWDRVSPTGISEELLFKYLENRVPVNKVKPKKPKGVDENIQLEWTLADLHYGMLAWDKEHGEDYDIGIARELLLDSASDIFLRSGKVKETVLVLMGDNFHTDFKSNQTEKSHHPLSVDSRYPKMVLTGAETFISAIEICLQYSEKVKVVVLYGNHDSHTSVNLQYMLYFNFRGVTDRVEIDLSPAKAHYNVWGSVASMYHHGDMTKKDRLVAMLNNHVIENDITGIRHRFVKQAHLHKEHIEDINKTTYEIVPSPVAKDGFATESCFDAKRASVASIYDKRDGLLNRLYITPAALKRKREQITD